MLYSSLCLFFKCLLVLVFWVFVFCSSSLSSSSSLFSTRISYFFVVFGNDVLIFLLLFELDKLSSLFFVNLVCFFSYRFVSFIVLSLSSFRLLKINCSTAYKLCVYLFSCSCIVYVYIYIK